MAIVHRFFGVMVSDSPTFFMGANNVRYVGGYWESNGRTYANLPLSECVLVETKA